MKTVILALMMALAIGCSKKVVETPPECAPAPCDKCAPKTQCDCCPIQDKVACDCLDCPCASGGKCVCEEKTCKAAGCKCGLGTKPVCQCFENCKCKYDEKCECGNCSCAACPGKVAK